jgi:hypothetical protein
MLPLTSPVRSSTQRVETAVAVSSSSGLISTNGLGAGAIDFLDSRTDLSGWEDLSIFEKACGTDVSESRTVSGDIALIG